MTGEGDALAYKQSKGKEILIGVDGLFLTRTVTLL